MSAKHISDGGRSMISKSRKAVAYIAWGLEREPSAWHNRNKAKAERTFREMLDIPWCVVRPELRKIWE